MYYRQRTWIDAGPSCPRSMIRPTRAPGYGVAMRRARGFGAVDCGPNPCGFWDFVPFPGLFTSAACNAHNECLLTGMTPTPEETPGGFLGLTENPLLGTPAAASGAAGGLTLAQLQQACAQTGGTWDAVTSQCAPNYLRYVPWVLGGLGLVLVLPALIGGRR